MAAAHKEHLVLEWEDICYSIKQNSILQGVSGRVESGELLAGTQTPPFLFTNASKLTAHAVMGPSGAGKSTILDIISRRTPSTHGTVRVFIMPLSCYTSCVPHYVPSLRWRTFGTTPALNAPRTPPEDSPVAFVRHYSYNEWIKDDSVCQAPRACTYSPPYLIAWQTLLLSTRTPPTCFRFLDLLAYSYLDNNGPWWLRGTHIDGVCGACALLQASSRDWPLWLV